MQKVLCAMYKLTIANLYWKDSHAEFEVELINSLFSVPFSVIATTPTHWMIKQWNYMVQKSCGVCVLQSIGYN